MGQPAQRVAGRGGQTSVGAASGRLAQRRIRAALLRPVRVSRSCGSAVMMTALSWLIAWVRALTAEARARRNRRSISMGPSPVFAMVVARRDSTAPGRGDGVDGVGLAVAAGGPVGAVDLDHGQPAATQVAAQRGAVGAGAFHPGAGQDAEAASPGQQLPVSGGGSGERRVGELRAQGGDDRGDVNVGVGVDPQDNLLAVPGIVVASDRRRGRPGRGECQW